MTWRKQHWYNNLQSLATWIQSIVILNTHILHIILLTEWDIDTKQGQTIEISLAPGSRVRWLDCVRWVIVTGYFTVQLSDRVVAWIVLSSVRHWDSLKTQGCVVYTVWSPQSAELRSSGSGLSGPVGVSCINNVTLLPTPKVSSA